MVSAASFPRVDLAFFFLYLFFLFHSRRKRLISGFLTLCSYELIPNEPEKMFRNDPELGAECELDSELGVGLCWIFISSNYFLARPSPELNEETKSQRNEATFFLILSPSYLHQCSCRKITIEMKSSTIFICVWKPDALLPPRRYALWFSLWRIHSKT